ncbi:DNA-binding transcriptional regulator, LysR family [Halobacillus alkaliphilus]|uniref:DNA-binding transcriptional regulator, LysR family n=1 Tax=Halobacillus alkaliphilus TaxID=396056 RepID=A0A1I2RMR0_9BACI|nr:LysR family transcriptional regulator [Halobacillus alkaliphilus]SFG41944.1 DNA-binding transcriptional regulator, LysR family [Halobacillus alkaliphilus]
MDIRHLQYFIEVARFSSFTKAADHLFISQPTISKMIKNLEADLGVELFERSRKKITLTDAGRVILAQAEVIDKAFNNLQTELDDLLGLQKGHIRIGLPPIMDADQFIKALGGFHDQYPHITFQLLENGAKKIEDNIIQEELDVGITVLPTEEERFDYFFLMSEELRVVLPPSHKLSGRKQIYLKELEEESFILFNKDFVLNDRIVSACKEAGFLPQVVSESSQWDFIGKMIAANLGISILPNSVAHLLKEDVRIIKVVQPVLEWDLAIIWPKDRYLAYATKEWLKFTQDRIATQAGKEQPLNE